MLPSQQSENCEEDSGACLKSLYSSVSLISLVSLLTILKNRSFFRPVAQTPVGIYGMTLLYY